MQNTSHAVMAQRVEPPDSLDYFPTPPWATRALCEWLSNDGGYNLDSSSCWEPACGEGHMSRPLAEYFREVYSSDVHPHGFGNIEDFLFVTGRWADFVISNPPFKLGMQFAFKARLVARRCAAMLVRTAFLESADRYELLFKNTPPSTILQFVERVPMVKGRLDKCASTATSYCWLVWEKEIDVEDGTHFHWIPPCRKRLERDSDYE